MLTIVEPTYSPYTAVILTTADATQMTKTIRAFTHTVLCHQNSPTCCEQCVRGFILTLYVLICNATYKITFFHLVDNAAVLHTDLDQKDETDLSLNYRGVYRV